MGQRGRGAFIPNNISVLVLDRFGKIQGGMVQVFHKEYHCIRNTIRTTIHSRALFVVLGPYIVRK